MQNYFFLVLVVLEHSPTRGEQIWDMVRDMDIAL